MAASELSMRLFINSKTKSVVYAEAGKYCVDLLLGIMSLPMAAVTWLLQEHGMVGCLSNMFKSFENLNADYVFSPQNKAALLTVMGAIVGSVSTVPPIFTAAPDGKRSVYSCPSCIRVYHSDQQQSLCPLCSYGSGKQKKLSGQGTGFVKGVMTYMVTDDLEIMPLATKSYFNLLNKYNIKDGGALEEREVHIGTDEALKLLKASLHSKKVLTDVFMTDS